MLKRMLFAGGVVAGLIATVPPAVADEFHYNNLLIGDRASGMGGAYTAVSDDPAGMYYNPAGIAYSSGKNLSASVNAYNVLNRTYKNVIGGSDWKRSSSSLLPNFFGIIQPIGNLKIGFSYAVPDSNSEDQDQAFNYSPNGWGQSTQVINFNNTNNTNLFGPTAAVQLADNFSIGATLYVHKRNTEAILNSSIESQNQALYTWRNDYLESDEWGVRPVVGIMWSPMDKLSLGFSAARTVVLSSEMLQQTTISTNDPNEPVNNPIYNIPHGFYRTNPGLTTTNAKRRYPYQFNAGAAFFPTDALLISADVSYIPGYDYVFDGTPIKRETVVNGAVGVEYYISKAWAVRTGLFTDFANTPKVRSGGSNQQEHIDLFGGSLTFSHFTRNTSITAGGSYKYGTGKSQISGGNSAIQDANADSWTVFLSSSYNY